MDYISNSKCKQKIMNRFTNNKAVRFFIGKCVALLAPSFIDFDAMAAEKLVLLKYLTALPAKVLSKTQ